MLQQRLNISLPFKSSSLPLAVHPLARDWTATVHVEQGGVELLFLTAVSCGQKGTNLSCLGQKLDYVPTIKIGWPSDRERVCERVRKKERTG